MAFVYKVQKGDTLNSIAQRYGFSNYKTAGISSVPSGNFDLIREGEQVTLANYDPNKLQTFQEGSPVVSSKDNAQQYRDDSNKLDGVLNGISAAVGVKDSGATDTKKTDTGTDKYVPFATGEKNADGRIETTGDPIRDRVNADTKEKSAKFTADAEASKVEYSNLYTTSLAAVDATAKATIDRINSSYDKRINEQRRINQINIDRVKAYGLGSGGQYTPIAFRDAISLREEEAADKISELDGQRNSLIADAKAARDAGASKLLREKLEDLDKIDTQLRTQLQAVEKEAEDQYKLLRDLRKEEEQKHLDAVSKMKERLAAIAPQYADQYDKMTPEEKDAFIKKLAEQTGLDYATIYGTLEGAITTAASKALDLKKKEADIEASKALATQRNASAAKSFADAALADVEKKTKTEMQNAIPETFKDAADFEKQRSAFVKKYGVDGSKYWDAVFNKDDVGDYQYETAGSGSGGSIKARAEAAGFDYEAMSEEYSDEEIDAALKARGL